MPRVRARRLTHARVYDGRVFRIERDRVRLSNGRVAELEIVRHRGSVVLVPQPSAREVILIRQYRYAIDRWIWELPAGSIDAGEAPLAAARRECEEEIGLSAGRVTRLGAWFPSPGFCDERMIFYRCADLKPPRRAPALDLDEQIEPRVFPLHEVMSMIARGTIIDMKTVVGVNLISRRGAAG